MLHKLKLKMDRLMLVDLDKMHPMERDRDSRMDAVIAMQNKVQKVANQQGNIQLLRQISRPANSQLIGFKQSRDVSIRVSQTRREKLTNIA